MGRIIIVTGKGGVGKTSVAAAHALKSAREGKKTLLVSADMAHNIGDIFEMELGSPTSRIEDRLYGLELDPDLLFEEEFPDIARALSQLFNMQGIAGPSDLSAHDLIPGFENLFSLLKIAEIYKSGEYDLIIVDCAPTGDTLSLLKLPELLSWYMEKFFPVGKAIVRILSPVSKALYQVSLPDRKAMNEVEVLHQRLLELQELLKDGSICSARLVCTPEKMVVEETKRNYMYLNLYRYQVDGVFVNRVIPKQPDNAFLSGWHDIQQAYMEELQSVFADLPFWEIPWYPEEVRGKAAIGRICDEILTEPELFSVLKRTENEIYVPIEGGYELRIKLLGVKRPHAETVCHNMEHVEAVCHNMEHVGAVCHNMEHVGAVCHNLDLDITVNNFIRRIPLPNVLRDVQPSNVYLDEDGVLHLSFLTGRQ